MSLGSLKFIRFGLERLPSAPIAPGIRVATFRDAEENGATDGGLAARLLFNSSLRKIVAFLVVGEFVTSLLKSADMFFGADPPYRCSFQKGTTRLSTAMEMPDSKNPPFFAL